jgi:hypothetical protein
MSIATSLGYSVPATASGVAHRFFGSPNVPDVWPIKKVSPNTMVHLTAKPVELTRRASSASNPLVPSAGHDGRG